MNFNFEDDEFDDLDMSNFCDDNVGEILNKIPEYNSERLCDIIITDRYLGINKDLAIACMEELGKRRLNGNSFEFENYIETEFNNLPKIDFSIPNLKDILGNFMKSGI